MSTNTESVAAKAWIQVDEPRNLPPEAQMISKILEDCINKVEIVGTLDVFLQSNCLSSVKDETFRKLLQKHVILVEKLQVGSKINSNEEQKGEGKKPRAKDQLEKDIKDSVRDLLRHVRHHPDALIGLQTEPGLVIGESECSLNSELKVFQTHVWERLQISLEERPHCKPVSPSTKAIMDSMVEEVTDTIKKVDERISEKNQEIKSLQSSLQKLPKEPPQFPLLNERQQEVISTSKKKQSIIQKQIDELKTAIDKVSRENREAEKKLHERNDKVKSETLDLIQTFDNKVEEIQAKLEMNELEYEREQEELRVLQERFSVLEIECVQIQEKRRLAEEKRKEEMRELEMKTKAAIVIQTWWRDYCARKALNKGKGKKGKEKKGEKKRSK
ncbi:dynein regulatory complex protein 10 [Antennarius striatus]|uniref:dynein regulatory complex protein 10 n=1 Tax=Antennarius striatus TaxID=241820 RepID=UPI0035B18218